MAFALPIRLGDVVFAGHRALTRLTDLRVAAPHGHRLSRAVRHLEWCFAEAERRGAVETDRVRFSEAARTVLYQYVVGRTVTAGDTAALALIPRTLDGHDTPAEDAAARSGARTAARDTEFELFAHALLRLAGVVGVVCGEPDLRVAAGDTTVGVAVKCIWNPDQLRRRVGKAIKQIRRHTEGGGVVVLGFDIPVLGLDARAADGETARLTARARDIILETRADDAVTLVIGVSTTARVDDAYGADRPSPATDAAPPLLALGVCVHVHAVLPPGEEAPVVRLLDQAGANARRGIERLLGEAHDPSLDAPPGAGSGADG